MLSDHEILKLRDMGGIVIHPFRREALNPNSYDLTLGPFIARYRRVLDGKLIVNDELRPAEISGAAAFQIEDCRERGAFIIHAGESLLCHTNEFIGGTGIENPISGGLSGQAVNTQMRATSTAGRWGLTACRCAGHGDAGYFDRWTLEVQNNSPRDVVLPVGAVICQLVFFAVSTPLKLYQEASGNYQQHRDLDRLVAEWKPEKMLPKQLKKTDFWKGMYVE